MEHIDDVLSDQIDQYLRGEMSPAERSNFEGLLSENPALQAALSERRDLVRGIRDAVWGDLRLGMDEELDALEREERDERLRRRRKIWLWVGVGVVALVGLWLCWLWFWEEKKVPTAPSPDVVLRSIPAADSGSQMPTVLPQHIMSAPGLNHTSQRALAFRYLTQSLSRDYETSAIMSGDEQSTAAPTDTMQAAFEAFRQKKWADALRLWEALAPQQWADHSGTRLALGAAYLQNRQPERAEAIFLEVASAQVPPQNARRAQWYLALAYLAQSPKKEQEFRNLLSYIQRGNPDYREQAQRLEAELGQR